MRPVLVSILGLVAAVLSGTEVIDRIAVVVGNQVITHNEILRELRTVAFLNGKPVDLSADAKRQAADRLVEQAFIKREIEVSRFPPPSAADTEKLLEQTKRDRFSTDEAFRAALQKYGLLEDELKQHLQWQLMTLRFIDYRFRPGVQVPPEEVRDYYERRFAPEWLKKSKEAVPSFEESREQIEQILTGERVDQVLDRWVNQQRTQTRIKFQEEAFR